MAATRTFKTSVDTSLEQIQEAVTYMTDVHATLSKQTSCEEAIAYNTFTKTHKCFCDVFNHLPCLKAGLTQKKLGPESLTVLTAPSLLEKLSQRRVDTHFLDTMLQQELIDALRVSLKEFNRRPTQARFDTANKINDFAYIIFEAQALSIHGWFYNASLQLTVCCTYKDLQDTIERIDTLQQLMTNHPLPASFPQYHLVHLRQTIHNHLILAEKYQLHLVETHI